MKRIKQRLLSLAMTGALLLGFTLPEAFAASAKSTKESSASDAQETTSEKSGKKQSKKKTSDAQAAEKSSKTKDKAGEKAKSSEEKASSGKSEKSDEKADSSKSDKSDEKADSSKSDKSEDKASSGKSDKSEDKASSGKSDKSEKNTKSSNKEVSLSLSISKPGGLSASGGVWQVDPGKVSALTLSWKCKGDCDSFEVSVSGGVYSASTEKKSAKISVSGLSEGKYTATVKAIRDGKTVAKAKLSFQIIASPADEAPEAPASESIGNDGAEASALQTDQPEAGIAAEGEDIALQPDSIEVGADLEAPAVAEDLAFEATDDETEAAEAVEGQDASPEQTAEEPSEEAVPAIAEDLVSEAAEDETEAAEAVEGQDASPEQTAEEPSEEAVPDAIQGLYIVVTQDANQVLSVDEALDVAWEQLGQEEDTRLVDTPVVKKKDAAVDQSAGEERLDLSQPDIQAPQEDAIEGQAVTEEALPDATPAELDGPALQLDETDEALALDETEALVFDGPSDEAVLLEVEGDSILSNAGDEREKGDDKLTLSVMGAEGLSVIDGALHVDPARAGSVTLVWSFGGACDEYAVSVSGGVYEKTTKKSQLKLPVKKLSPGQYTLTVAANKDGKALSSARLGFTVDAADSGEETAGLAIAVASPQGLLITEGVYQVDPAQVEALTFTWQFGGECDAFDVSVSGDVYSGQTEEATVTVPLSGLAAGTYTVTVVALRDGEAAARGQLSFNIPSQDEKSEEDQGKDGKQGDQPRGGGQRSGGQKGGAAKGSDAQEADQGFHVTPGEALIGTHTSGNRDMRLYGAVALTLDTENPMNVLTLGDTVLDIRLSDGGLFTATIEENVLALVPRDKAQAWLLNGYALKTLALSGVTSLRLTLDDMTVEFPTLPELSGSNYGMLCAAGRTSRDYSYAVSSNGCTVTVADQSYQLTVEGELV
ncbi:MAG: hypothetical protein IJI71_08745 [Clostridia bacterium]|nr:hypothetical protein [Clostridia bacterium]